MLLCNLKLKLPMDWPGVICFNHKKNRLFLFIFSLCNSFAPYFLCSLSFGNGQELWSKMAENYHVVTVSNRLTGQNQLRRNIKKLKLMLLNRLFWIECLPNKLIVVSTLLKSIQMHKVMKRLIHLGQIFCRKQKWNWWIMVIMNYLTSKRKLKMIRIIWRTV